MDKSDLVNVAEAAVRDKENPEVVSKYVEEIRRYAKVNKTTDELVEAVICAIDVDCGSNYLDYLEGLSKGELQKAWKTIKENKLVKKEKKPNAVKLLFGILYLSIIRSGSFDSILDKVIVAINTALGNEERGMATVCYGPIFKDYFVKKISGNFVFPKWKNIKNTPEAILNFTSNMLRGIEGGTYECQHVKKWLKEGKIYAEEEIEKKQVEAKIPASQIENLQGIVEHYMNVEQLLRESISRVAFLEGKIENLNDEISEMSLHEHELERKIKALQGDISERDKNLDIAGKELEERKKLNQAQVQYREDAQVALLQEIARELKAEYADFLETKNASMNEMLGEIYREKLKNIAKILEKKGIKVEN